MKLTDVFRKTAAAYNSGKRIIINRGSSRSSKTFTTEQLLYIIAKNSKKPLIIDTVGETSDTLRRGAITNFEQILRSVGIIPELVRKKNPYIYKIGESEHQFISIDNPGKALGSPRNILFMNEANRIPWETAHQLIIRTEDTIFIDYNPSHSFWVDEQGISNRPDAITIDSTFLDNIENITEGQIHEFYTAKQKHDAEIEKGVKGYWYNYWRVYGLGLQGQLEGTIFNYWRIGDFDDSLPYVYGMDWGQSDPHTLIKVAVDRKNRKVYVDELHYAPIKSTGEVLQMVAKYVQKNEVIISDWSSRTISNGKQGINDLRQQGFNVIPAHKPPGSVLKGIRDLQDYEIIITARSYNAKIELQSYVWLDKNGDVPIDAHNHIIDPLRYCHQYLQRMY